MITKIEISYIFPLSCWKRMKKSTTISTERLWFWVRVWSIFSIVHPPSLKSARHNQYNNKHIRFVPIWSNFKINNRKKHNIHHWTIILQQSPTKPVWYNNFKNFPPHCPWEEKNNLPDRRQTASCGGILANIQTNRSHPIYYAHSFRTETIQTFFQVDQSKFPKITGNNEAAKRNAMIFNQLVEDIREEPSVWSLKLRPKAEDLEDAWRRIASKNNLSGECGFAKIVGDLPGVSI